MFLPALIPAVAAVAVAAAAVAVAAAVAAAAAAVAAAAAALPLGHNLTEKLQNETSQTSVRSTNCRCLDLSFQIYVRLVRHHQHV